MQTPSYIYSFSYDTTEDELCKLESRHIFDDEEKDKLLFSDRKIEPSCSAFIKIRLDISLFSDDYLALIQSIKAKNICAEGFKVEYLVLKGDTLEYPERLKKLKDIGYSIEGDPDYYNPTITYALCYHKGIWYFGTLIKDTFDWYKHKDKPHSYSNSISVNIAKALVNIAAKANKEKSLLDACCGVGTIMLEACFAGYTIEGNDINWKVCRQSRANLAHFGYDTTVYRSDIKDISNKYDAAIIDLPYNLLSCISDTGVQHIIDASADVSERLIIVSTTDISTFIADAGLELLDTCEVSKRGKTTFVRRVWVCEKSK